LIITTGYSKKQIARLSSQLGTTGTHQKKILRSDGKSV